MPETWPLTLLADKLKAGPPLISEICNLLESIDSEKAFLELIRMFLPKYETNIMREPRNRRVYRFGYIFGQVYYPLPLNTECGPRDLINGLPVELMGLSYSAYHELDMRPGYLLLLSLVIYPYAGDWRDDEDDCVPFDPAVILPTLKYKPSVSDIDWVIRLVHNLAIGGVWVAPMGFSMVKVAENKIELREALDTPEVKETICRTLLIAKRAGIEAGFSSTGRTSQEKLNGARVPLLGMVRNMVGVEIASPIPAAGWRPEELHRITDGTPYHGVGDFADWVCSETGCVMLDSSFDNVHFMEGMSEPVFKWTRQNVVTLTEQWPKVKCIREDIDYLVEWLEADQINNFRELLDFILKRNPKNAEDTGGHGYDPWEHFSEDIESVVRSIEKVPPKHLLIIELANQIPIKYGELDYAEVAERQPEINLAIAEANVYGAHTIQAVDALIRLQGREGD
ncbi:hypothetical protein ES705_45079 [subsurface metagenome]